MRGPGRNLRVWCCLLSGGNVTAHISLTLAEIRRCYAPWTCCAPSQPGGDMRLRGRPERPRVVGNGWVRVRSGLCGRLCASGVWGGSWAMLGFLYMLRLLVRGRLAGRPRCGRCYALYTLRLLNPWWRSEQARVRLLHQDGAERAVVASNRRTSQRRGGRAQRCPACRI